MKKKVLVDTNIILSTISKKSSAHLLRHFLNDFKFYVSGIIREEIEKVICKSKRSKKEIQDIKLQVTKYLEILEIQTIDDSHHDRKYKSKDENDSIIFKVAKEQNMDFICTYNLKDFLSSSNSVEIITPLNLFKNSSLEPNALLQLYFNLTGIMEKNFAIYFGFNFRGVVDPLVIFKDTASNYRLVIDKKHKLRLLKNDSIVKISKVSLDVEVPVKLHIVVLDGRLRVFNLSNEINHVALIDSKVSSLKINYQDILPFNSSGNFYGHIRDVSSFVLKDMKKLISKDTLKNISMQDSLEYLWGNIEI